MPHFQIDYSGNLDARLNMAALCETIRQTAAGLECFPTAGIRVRAVRVDHYKIADGNPDHGFIDLSVRLRAGRSMDVKQEATEVILEALRKFVAQDMAQNPLALSFEMRDIDPALSPKTGSIRDHMEVGL